MPKEGGYHKNRNDDGKFTHVIPNKPKRVQLNSPYGEFVRGTEGKAYVKLKNGLEGEFIRYTSAGWVVKWDDIHLEIPVPEHWLKPANVFGKVE